MSQFFTLEYAQFVNGRFVAWQEAGTFATYAEAAAVAAAHGLRHRGNDHLISAGQDDMTANLESYLAPYGIGVERDEEVR